MITRGMNEGLVSKYSVVLRTCCEDLSHEKRTEQTKIHVLSVLLLFPLVEWAT